MEGPAPRKNVNDLGRRSIAVAVLGASAKPERYSNKAVKLLVKKGYTVFPVHPSLSEIDGIPVYRSLTDVQSSLDTVAVYVSPELSNHMRDEILQAKPRRVIFNPGAENPILARELQQAGIEVVNACTLVMLTTGQFD